MIGMQAKLDEYGYIFWQFGIESWVRRCLFCSLRPWMNVDTCRGSGTLGGWQYMGDTSANTTLETTLAGTEGWTQGCLFIVVRHTWRW